MEMMCPQEDIVWKPEVVDLLDKEDLRKHGWIRINGSIIQKPDWC